jgi:hypothetical protein
METAAALIEAVLRKSLRDDEVMDRYSYDRAGAMMEAHRRHSTAARLNGIGPAGSTTRASF